jgi:hypothetical protein
MEPTIVSLVLSLAVLAAQPASSPVIDLSAAGAELNEAFNKADGKVRLVLFLSPT